MSGTRRKAMDEDDEKEMETKRKWERKMWMIKGIGRKRSV